VPRLAADGPAADALVHAVASDWRSAALPRARACLCAFAEKLTFDQHRVSAADLDALRAHGFDDRAIHDAVQVIAYFNYVTRVADGLASTRNRTSGTGAGSRVPRTRPAFAALTAARPANGRRAQPYWTGVQTDPSWPPATPTRARSSFARGREGLVEGRTLTMFEYGAGMWLSHCNSSPIWLMKKARLPLWCAIIGHAYAHHRNSHSSAFGKLPGFAPPTTGRSEMPGVTPRGRAGSQIWKK